MPIEPIIAPDTVGVAKDSPPGTSYGEAHYKCVYVEGYSPGCSPSGSTQQSDRRYCGMKTLSFLINIGAYLFSFCFMRFFFGLWASNYFKHKKIMKAEKETSKISKLIGLQYFTLSKDNMLFAIIYGIFLLLFFSSLILFVCEFIFQSNTMMNINNLLGKLLWYFFCLVAFVNCMKGRNNKHKKS